MPARDTTGVFPRSVAWRRSRRSAYSAIAIRAITAKKNRYAERTIIRTGMRALAGSNPEEPGPTGGPPQPRYPRAEAAGTASAKLVYHCRQRRIPFCFPRSFGLQQLLAKTQNPRRLVLISLRQRAEIKINIGAAAQGGVHIRLLSGQHRAIDIHPAGAAAGE